MLISKLGEFGLIKRIRKLIKTDSSVIKGSGDDCAVLEFDKNSYMLFTCDMIIEGIDFLSNENPWLIGRKALAINISDIASCGGRPKHCLVSLGIPKNKNVAFVDKLCKGMIAIANKYNINIVGGDISRSRDLTIDVSMLGFTEKENLVLRSGARIGDMIFVSGGIGSAIKGKHFTFTPRLREARYLVEHFKVNAMIDISDGLIQDLGHILEESRVGALLYEDLIPLNKDAHSLNDALYSGEDFELLFTLPHIQARRLFNRTHILFKPIGRILEKNQGLKIIDSQGRERKLKIKGYRHF